VGGLSQAREEACGNNGPDDGFSSGGRSTALPSQTNRIDSFPFSSPFATAIDIGDLSTTRRTAGGQNSSTDAYVSAGITGSYTFNTIVDSFPFSSPFATASNIGDVNTARSFVAAHSSSTDGFTAGGGLPASPTFTDIVDSFPFSSPFTTATNVGNLGRGVDRAASQSSASDGYISGGDDDLSPILTSTRIDSYPFSAPFTTTSSIGNLSLGRQNLAGHQG
jgi:hypothetical protein